MDGDGAATDVWRPSLAQVERANVTRLIRRAGVRSVDELRRRSVQDPEWFWDDVVHDLRLPFHVPYRQVLDTSQGVPWAKWFVGGRVNLATACLGRWRGAGTVAIDAFYEDGERRVVTHAELATEVDRLANALRADGVRPGDVVGVFLPMIPEAVVAAYAVALVGAIYLPIFSGFAPGAIASRLRDAGARAVVTADGGLRRGRAHAMKPVLDEALQDCPTVRRVVVVARTGQDVAMRADRDVTWDDYVAGRDGVAAPEDTDAEHPFMLAYTSGTTGRPKGAVHVHGGFLVKIAAEVAYQADLRAGEALYWVTDMGWIMGPWAMVGAGALGGAMVLAEGSPDHPDPGRVWRIVEDSRAAVVGVSPTLVRSLKVHGESWVRGADLSSLRIIGSTGEPWNPEPYAWLAREVGGGRLPIINISGGTEVGACLLSPHPVEPIRPCSLGGPALGMDVDVFDPQGRPLRGEVGELVCKAPWPGMTRGVWGDPERYLASYWSTYPGVWRHGDWARIDPDGQWFLLGRSDEAVNIAGKRLGPAEVESVLVGHPAVAEAAAVGVPHDVTGEAVWCFWTPVDPAGPDVGPELAERVAHELGRPFRPARVLRVPALPRTRSAKILRRAVRAAALGEDPGDLSTAENPEALDAIRAAVAATAPPAAGQGAAGASAAADQDSA
ncbi:MAG: AMP-binding protein [Actinomycetota bacterium]